ncbi:MAG: penicillin-binding protein 2, partial [Acidimicrobiia bacterium]|nr:penicillin-binding protein 2 [Acidimicrobiia bacterium]
MGGREPPEPRAPPGAAVVTEASPPLRVAVIGIVCLSLFAALFARLYYLQVLEPTALEEVRPLPSEEVVRYQAERGRILDRTGTQVLVDSRQSIEVTIDRQAYEAVEDKAGLLGRLARALNEAGVPIKVRDIESRLVDPMYDPFKPVPIAHDVSAELEVELLERSFEFPSVDTSRVWLRTYPNGPVASHLLGYVGAVNEADLGARQASTKPYQPGDEIGRAGVEYMFESDLRGVPEERRILVDLRNEQVGTASVSEPETGDDLVLTIDLALQRQTEQLLAKALAEARQQPKREPEDPDATAPAGSVVVLDVQTGELLAMASFPAYDPAEFVGGISSYRFSELNDPAAHHPLLNRAVQSIYAPGSTFKPVTAYAALRTGLLDPDEEYVDRGFYEIESCQSEGGAGCEFQNAGRAAYGRVDFHRSLVVSSDTYYYRLGEQFWNSQDRFGPTPIQDAARGFGLGTPTGVQLPGESAGLITDPAAKAARHAENPEAFPVGDWFTGDNVNLAIGQGDLAVTPLQLANVYATLANGGRVLAPSVARAVLDHDTGQPTRSFEPRELGRVDLPPEIAELIHKGLAGVVSEDEGTAYEEFAGFPLEAFPVAGKTGTAQVQGKADTALFAAYGPTTNPRYAVVAVLEESGFGADVAVPLVRQVLEGHG